MSSPHPRLDRTRGPAFAFRVTWVASILVLATTVLAGCAGTTPKPVVAHPTASRSPGPCWLLNIEELTNNTNNTLQQQDDSLQLVATYRFGKSGHEVGGAAHSPVELSSRTTRWRVDEWTDHLHTHPTAICSPEGVQPPVQLNGQVSSTN